jgi:hypothetical protein
VASGGAGGLERTQSSILENRIKIN